ncbi:MAG: hypothetical protein J6Q48_06765 [Bacteroidaceae bacterium]|nr:hypothetical protein [Bacteroidaceae bacterium]
MSNWTEILYLIAILIESALLFYLECKIWKTLYTPLNFLMLPYLIVLLITIMVAGSELGFVEFYYPSILIWNVGLLIFFLPSLILGLLMTYNGKNVVSQHPSDNIPISIKFLLIVVALLFLIRLRSSLGSSVEGELGSKQFSDEFSGGGLWGHLRILTLPLLMMSIFYVSKKRWWLWPIILIFLSVSILNQVVGWIVIPVFGAIVMRLYSGKTRLTVKLVLLALSGAFLVFFAAYALAILVVQSRGVDDAFLDFIFMHFLHYFTSGVLGLSMDMQFNFPDAGNFEILWAPIVNLINVVVGIDDMVSPVNPCYYNSGINLTNVRTFFGTIYIYTTSLQFIVYLLLSSTLMYLLKLATIKWKNIYVYVIYFFECGLLAMGWFEFYYFHLVVFELPVIVALLWFLEWGLRNKKDSCYKTDECISR